MDSRQHLLKRCLCAVKRIKQKFYQRFKNRKSHKLYCKGTKKLGDGQITHN